MNETRSAADARTKLSSSLETLWKLFSMLLESESLSCSDYTIFLIFIDDRDVTIRVRTLHLLKPK